MVGMPSRVRAHCGFGRYHNIEVEDDVTAYLEFPNGATGVFITSTGESPGTNRLEITGERGRLVYENGALTFVRNAVPVSEFSRTTKEAFGHPATETILIPIEGQGGQHVEMLENFAAAILDGAPLIAPGAEGMASVELACAMVLSAWREATVKLPISGAAYARELSRRVRRSKHVKTAPPAGPVVVDMNSSFAR
jgi:predicted dehydrogenase